MSHSIEHESSSRTETMTALKTLLYMGLVCLVQSAILADTPACAVFKFESPNVENGVLAVKERASVNITFSVIKWNCSSVMYGDIIISKYDPTVGIFMPQCRIVNTCEDHPPENNISCHCLGSPAQGFPRLYSASFVVSRKHGVMWKWSTKGNAVNNTFMQINVSCPPEFQKSTLNIQNFSIGQNDVVTFPFRSYTTNISSCRISRKEDTNSSLTAFMNCTKGEGIMSNVYSENKHCMYFVTGDHRDLHLNIIFRNLKRQDGGQWYVTISNDEGSDVIHIQVSINDQAELKLEFVIIGAVLVVIAFSAIASIFVVCIKKCKGKYASLNRRAIREGVYTKGIDTVTVECPQSQYVNYYDIPDTELDTDI